MKPSETFEVKAGAKALEFIRTHGLHLKDVDVVLGAAGGPKWLVLSGLDKLLAPALLSARQRPVHLIGASIGTWRFACYGQPDPAAAIDAFADGYINQHYPDSPSLQEVDVGARKIIDGFLGGDALTGSKALLEHPTLRLGILAVRSRGLTVPEARWALGAGLITTATANFATRLGAGLLFRQTLFHDPREAPSLEPRRGLPVDLAALTPETLPLALMASSAIPGLMSGVDDIAGAPPGRYRDGGIVDYHLDLPLGDAHGLILHTHFYHRVVPGWFDKTVPWRKARHLDRVVMVCPSRAFVESLPGQRIPNRKDFERMSDDERITKWWVVVEAARALGEGVMSAIERGEIAGMAQPF